MQPALPDVERPHRPPDSERERRALHLELLHLTPTLVKCPTCGRRTEWSESAPFRPFCSDRCRLIDLGAWISEQRSIPGENATPPADPTPSDDDR